MQNEKIMRCNVQNIKVLMKILKFQKVHLHPHTYTKHRPCSREYYFLNRTTKLNFLIVQELDEIRKQIIMLKERVRKTLLVNENATSPLRDANLIDLIQRLGLYHHFEYEIGELLRQIHNNYVENGTITLSEDLNSIALVFRLLRQQGYHILPGIVNDLTLKGFLYKD
jgi:hypothetical protein